MARLLLMVWISLALSTSVLADEDPTFKHSPNGERALKQHRLAVTALSDEFYKLVAQADVRFVQTAKRDLQRYDAMVEREVRMLTRQGNLETAKAANDLRTKVAALEITAPDAQGSHFLSLINLEVPGSEKINKYGVDLLLNIETAGLEHAKQAESFAEQYRGKVQRARVAYTAALGKVLTNEQRAGRIEAVTELQQQIEAQKDLPAIIAPPLRPGAESKPTELVKAKGPAYAGYYIFQYTSGFLERQKLLVQLNADGGAVQSRFVYTSSTKGKWEPINLPITITKKSEELLTFTHKDELRNTDVVHELALKGGKPEQDLAWASQKDRDVMRGTAKGEIHVAGSPGADLLGLVDGVYILKMTERRQDKYRPDTFHIKHYTNRIVVENGLIYRTHRSRSDDPTEMEPLGKQFLCAHSKDSKLYLTYDRNMFSTWEDVYIFNMKVENKDELEMVGWWNEDDFKNGLKPILTGKLTRYKGE